MKIITRSFFETEESISSSNNMMMLNMADMIQNISSLLPQNQIDENIIERLEKNEPVENKGGKPEDPKDMLDTVLDDSILVDVVISDENIEFAPDSASDLSCLSNEITEQSIRNELESLNYRELQSKTKSLKISGKGSKNEIINRLIEKILS